MRIVCDNCGAKYQISDEKVRNKVFKIRCKRCAHVIVVRANEQAEQAAEAPAAQSAEAAPAAEAAAPAGAIWYVVINREQVGPLTPEQVLAHFERKEIDADTFTWAEGMTDWVRLATVPEFADQVAAALQAAAPQPAAEPAAAPAAAAAAGGGSLFDDGDDDDDVIASSAQGESLFGDEKDGFDDGGDGPRVSSASQLRNQRNENSVLFSLDSLAADAEPSRPGVTNTGGADGSGLIDISALGSGAPAVGAASGAALDDAFGGGADAGGFAPVSAAPAGPMPTYVTRPTGGGGGKVAIIAVVVLLLLGGGAAAFFMLNKDDTPTSPASTASAAPASSAPATVAIGAPKSAPPAPATTASAASVASAAPASAPATAAPASAAPTSVAMAGTSAKKPAARRRPRRPKAPARTARKSPEDVPPAAAPRTAAPAPRRAPARPKKNDEVDDLLGNLDGGGNKSRGKRPAAAPAPAAGGNPLLPEKLSKRQILQVVRKNAGKISGCKSQDPNASGTVKVTIVINGNGRVGSASIPSGPFKGSPVGSCVEGKVRSFRFPQFSGDAMRINMPFRL